MLTEFTLCEPTIRRTLKAFLAGHGLIKKSDLPAVMEKLRAAAEEGGPVNPEHPVDTPSPHKPSRKPSRNPLRLSGTVNTVNGIDPEEAIEQAERIAERCEDLPSRAADFGESVAENCREIAANIETHQRVTPGQQEALDNMESGVEAWLHS